MLLLWCACDAKFQTIDAHINRDFTYVPNDYGPWLCRNIFSPVIGSKYDVLMTPNAAAWAYYDLIYKKGLSIDMVLSARQDLLQHIMRTYKLKHLELELKLDDNEIYKYGGFNDNYRGA